MFFLYLTVTLLKPDYLRKIAKDLFPSCLYNYKRSTMLAPEYPNNATRVVSGSKKYNHSKPVL